MKIILKPKPTCTCGNTQHELGYCDGSHNNNE